MSIDRHRPPVYAQIVGIARSFNRAGSSWVGMFLRFIFDGGLAVSVSMLLAALTNDYIPWGDVKGQDGVVILAGMLLFPSAIVMYGGTRMIFSAYEAYKEKKQKREQERIEYENALMERGRKQGLEQGRKQGLEQGRKQERERMEGGIEAVLANMSEVERGEILRFIRGRPESR